VSEAAVFTAAAVARRHSFPERRGELQPKTAMRATRRAPEGASVARSSAVTYNNTIKIAPFEASVLIESLKERKQRVAPQNDHQETSVLESTNTGSAQPATLAQERTTSRRMGNTRALVRPFEDFTCHTFGQSARQCGWCQQCSGLLCFGCWSPVGQVRPTSSCAHREQPQTTLHWDRCLCCLFARVINGQRSS